jgi:hypothetical protein
MGVPMGRKNSNLSVFIIFISQNTVLGAASEIIGITYLPYPNLPSLSATLGGLKLMGMKRKNNQSQASPGDAQ